MSTISVTPERFAQGMTFDEYVRFVGTPENLQREATNGAARSDRSEQLRTLYQASHLNEHQTAVLRELVGMEGGPAKILVIGEEWSSDCRRDIPTLARMAEAADLELRIFTRDGQRFSATPEPTDSPNADLMAQFLNRKAGGPFQSIPVAAFFTGDMQYIYHYTEYPAIYDKDRIVYGHFRAPRPGETPEQTDQRGNREFGAFQEGHLFRVYACAAVDEMLACLHRKLLLGSL